MPEKSFMSFIRRQFRKAGRDLVKFPVFGSLDYVLRFCDINVVLDVGANIGQTGYLLRQRQYQGRIISFEPLSEAFDVLKSKCQRDPLWNCHPYACGAEEGEAEIHVAAHSDYSSFLPTTAYIEGLDGGSKQARSEKVKVRRLDNLWPELKVEGDRVLLKVDTQGFEKQVLEGAEKVLGKISAVQLEMSLHPIYVGQPMFTELMAMMAARDYVVAGLQPGGNSRSGELLEFDCIFLRQNRKA